ncbi:MAG: hypothetical protein ACLQQ4_18480, partial [Bacteroidia bacterium]
RTYTFPDSFFEELSLACLFSWHQIYLYNKSVTKLSNLYNCESAVPKKYGGRGSLNNFLQTHICRYKSSNKQGKNCGLAA